MNDIYLVWAGYSSYGDVIGVFQNKEDAISCINNVNPLDFGRPHTFHITQHPINIVNGECSDYLMYNTEVVYIEDKYIKCHCV